MKIGYKKSIIYAAILSCSIPAYAGLGSLFNNFTGKMNNKAKPEPVLMNFASGAQYMTCFVPDGASCERLLVDEINRTQHSLFVQAYSFTNKKIGSALIQAKNRGVDVHVLIDFTQTSSLSGGLASSLTLAGVPVYTDNLTALGGTGVAHNKVMIFDQSSVFTGSFNFSEAAENRNAENGLLIINDPELIREYSANWVTRFKKSKPYKE